jgi:hypothetical protein
MTDAELETKLQEIRAKNPGDSHSLYMKEVWLLIALGRQSEGVTLARRAQQVWAVNRAKVSSPYGGSIYWDPWIAEAAVALAEGDWSRAEECSRRVLCDFGEEDSAGFLHELALEAQGRLHPDRVLKFGGGAEALANFDLRAYALKRAERLP